MELSRRQKQRAGDSYRRSLWATGAIGAAVGLGSYDVAVVISIMTFLTLRFMSNVKTPPDGDDDKP